MEVLRTKTNAETKGQFAGNMNLLQFTPHPSIDGSFDVACAVLCMDVHYEEKYSGCAHLYTNDMPHVHNINAGLLSSLFRGRLTLIHQKTAASHFYAAHHLFMGLKHAGHPPQMR